MPSVRVLDNSLNFRVSKTIVYIFEQQRFSLDLEVILKMLGWPSPALEDYKMIESCRLDRTGRDRDTTEESLEHVSDQDMPVSGCEC